MTHWTVRSALAASVAVAAVALAVPASAQARAFNVPAQSAVTGIAEFARQADIQILASDSAVRGKSTKAVRGRLNVEDALKRLLSGTGLRVTSSDGRTYTLAATHAVAAALPAAQAAQQPAAAPAPDEEDSGDIIVTANKRNERELDIAGAIKTFGGDQLLEQGMTSMKDYATLTPGVQINQSLGSGAPVIRGISTGLDVGALAGIVVNGAQIGSSSTLTAGAADSLDLDPIDLQRVEVLKGPQGTLYGANTLSGLISYTLRDPDLNEVSAVARGELSGTQHGGTNWSVRGALSAPLIQDKLGVRVSGYRDRKGGFIDNNVRNFTNQNDGVNWGASATVLAEPTDRLRVMLAGFHQRTDVTRDSVIYSFATRRPRDGDLEYNDYLTPVYDKTIKALIGTIDYEFDFAQLSSISAYQKLHSFTALNASGGTIAATLPLFALFGGPVVPTPSATSIYADVRLEKFTQEVRLTSTGDGPLQWILGGYYVHEDNDYDTGVNQTTTTGVNIPSLSPALLFGIVASYREYAGFGNLTYKFSDAFDISGGIRVGEIDQAFQQSFGGSDAAAYNALLGTLGVPPTPALTPVSTAKKTVINYLATARYHFSPDGMVFARFATGFRPGGPNLVVVGLPPTFTPDTTRNYEIGIKSKFWGGKGTIDVTGYYTDWKNIIVAVGAGGVSGFGNGGNARVYGVESALTLRPVTGLTLTGTLAYSNAKISDVNPLGGGAAAAGDRLPNNPRWSGALVADYRFPAGETWQGVVGGIARFVGSRHVAFASSSIPPDYIMPAYSLFDVHAGVQSEKIDIDLFVRNLTDKRAQLGAYTYYGFPEVTVQRPRTFGAAVTVRY